MIVLAHRLERRDGSFAGVVYADAATEAFRQPLSSWLRPLPVFSSMLSM